MHDEKYVCLSGPQIGENLFLSQSQAVVQDGSYAVKFLKGTDFRVTVFCVQI